MEVALPYNEAMNWSLICSILRSVSQQLKDAPEARIRFPQIDEISDRELNEYLRHCHELGYLDVRFVDGGPVRIRRMTAHGYKALDDICKGRYSDLYAGLGDKP